jgi:uncharacterized protein (TIGR02246 family)
MYKLFLLAVSMSVAISTLSAADDSSGEAAVRGVIQKYMDARDQRDAAALSALFTDDVDQLVSSGEWRRGREAVTKGTLGSSQSTGGKRTITIETVRFIASDVSLADGRYELTGLANGETRKMWTSILLKKGPDGWHISAIRNMLPAAPVPAK